MMPFFFGEGSRRLFGVYEPAAGESAKSKATVICAPWGPDHVVSYASLRRLAANLADRGRHILRFDYYGLGDSSGETGEADLDGWRDDIELAIEELKSMADAPQVSLIGLRVGATLAAEIAADRRDIDALVLWDPVLSGTVYLDELRADHREFVRERSRYSSFLPTGEPNLSGFPLPARMEAQLAALDLERLAPRLKQKILLVSTRNVGGYDAVTAKLAERGRLTVEHVNDTPPWKQDELGFGGVIPHEALRKIVAWAA